jgi:GNAT superfamily N-acetyltransferase
MKGRPMQPVAHDRIVVRNALASEQKTLEALQWRASLNNPGDRDALLANPDAIHLPVDQIERNGVFVAVDDDVVLGFAAILPRPDGDFELDALFVEPAAWKQGIGRTLTEHCVAAARENGANFLHVTGNPHAEGFYLACQFEIVGTTQTRFGEGLRMKRALRARQVN